MSILDTPVADVGGYPASNRQWSDFQKEIFRQTSQSRENILVQAVAGSGKTTTIVEATNHTQGSTLFLAFNKAIAEEIRQRTFCDVKTLNALGHKVLCENLRGSTLDAKKLDLIIQRIPQEEFRKEYGYSIKRAVGLAKNCAFGLDGEATKEDFSELIDSYLDVPSEMLDAVALASLSVFEQSIEETQTFDFDDQLYLPLARDWHYSHFDTVFIDECQDLSPIQHKMLSAFNESGSRLIAVGDRHQAIYGFRGALHDSMDSLKKRFSMLELPLSISYRCAKRIVAEAQLYSEHIQPAASAAEGMVNYVGDGEKRETDPELFGDSFILCRNNAPLFKAILRHIRARRPCRVMSNFLESMQGFIRSFKVKDSRSLQPKLDSWREKELRSAENKGFAGKIAAIEDKYETLSLFCREYSSVQEILNCLKSLSECTVGPTFATIHKAKGLEHQNVYILRPDLMPAFYATSPEQIQQESNLTYVAITRAKTNLSWGERKSY